MEFATARRAVLCQNHRVLERSTIVFGAIAAACAVSMTVPGTAAASPSSFVPPELSFEATGPDQITATVHNLNRSGVCWATIELDGTLHEFAEYSGAGYAPAGETIKVVRSGLPAGRYTVAGGCGAKVGDPEQAVAVGQQVKVPKDSGPLNSGSAGSGSAGSS